VAQTLYQGQVLRIWQAEAITEETTTDYGTMRCTQKQIDVATGNGWLRLHEVQLPNGKRMTTQAFLSAHPVNSIKLG
jgi:methionyl-tRNA formyltransferase